MRNLLLILVIALSVLNCSHKPETYIPHLEGYWEIKQVEKDGKVVKNVRDSELTAEEITKINQAGQVIQPLGFTEKFESGFGDISLFSKENKPSWFIAGVT